jgi:WD40 repeat protein
MDGSDSGNPIRGRYYEFFVGSIMALTFSPSGDAVACGGSDFQYGIDLFSSSGDAVACGGGSDQMIRIMNLQDASRKSIETPHG